MSNRIDRESLLYAVQSCPAGEIPAVIQKATGVRVPGQTVVAGETEATYHLHELDRANKVERFKEIFSGCSKETVESEVAWVYDSLRHSEKRTRENRPDNPYWFVEHQIEECRANLTAGKAKRAFAYNLNEHNHGHSGFTGIVVRVYFSPLNDEERLLSSTLRELHIDVAKALLSETGPSNVAWEYMDVEVIMMCLWRLGANAPDDLIDGLKKLLEGCVAMENPWQCTEKHLEETNKRFP